MERKSDTNEKKQTKRRKEKIQEKGSSKNEGKRSVGGGEIVNILEVGALRGQRNTEVAH